MQTSTLIHKNIESFNLTQQARKFLLMFMILLTIVQQFPLIYESYYSEFRYFLYFLFGAFAILSVFSIRTFLSNRLILLFIFGLISAIFVYLLGYYLDTYILFEVIIEMLVPLGIIICALSIDISKKELHFFMLSYILLCLIMGLRTIFFYGEGFVLSRDVYIIANKNQIGPLLGIASIIVLLSIFDKRFLNIRFFGIVPKLAIFSLLFVCILVMRNRASAGAIFITLFLYLLFGKKILFNRNNFMIFFASLLLFIVLFYLGPLRNIIDFIWESFTRNYDIDDLDSITAGRFLVYLDSITFIKENPIAGQLSGSNFYANVHNFLLRKWVDYGIFLSLPMVILYFYLYYFSLKNIFKKNNASLLLMVSWLLIFSLIISNLEYSYPFGPGVSQIMLWFLLGISIKYYKGNNISTLLTIDY